jgi:hypothetical protein
MAEAFRVHAHQEDLMKFTHAMSFAPGMDELDLDTWRELNDLLEGGLKGEPTRARLFVAAIAALGEQIREWEWLDRPSSHEKWFARKYGEPRPNLADLLPDQTRVRDLFGYLDDTSMSDDRKTGILIGMIGTLHGALRPLNFEELMRAFKKLHDESWRGRRGRPFPTYLLPESWQDVYLGLED